MPITPMPQRPRLNALTGVRFFAALHVVLFHVYRLNIMACAATLAKHAEHARVPVALLLKTIAAVMTGVVNTGFASVSLFFILSGFILAYCYLTPAATLIGSRRQFWINRFARVYPTYLLGLVIISPIVLRQLLIEPASPKWGECLGTGVLNVTLLQSWYSPLATTWNYPGWSLCDEAFFYLMFPFLAAVVIRGGGRTSALARAAGCVIMVAAFAGLRAVLSSGAWFPRLHDSDLSPYATFSPLLRLPEFVLGIAIGRIYALSWGKRLSAAGSGPVQPIVSEPVWLRLMAPMSLLGVIAALSVPDPYTMYAVHPWTAVARTVVVPALFAMFVYGLATDDIGRPRGLARLLGVRGLVLLGDASYAVYILHIPMLRWFDRVDARQWAAAAHRLHLPSGGSLNIILYLGATIGLAVVVFQFLETPARLWVRGRLDRLLGVPVSTRRGPAESPVATPAS